MILPFAFGAALIRLHQDPVVPQVPIETPPPRVQDTKLPTAILPPTNPGETVKFGLDEAVRIALRDQPGIAGARGAVTTAQGRARQTEALQNPQLTLGGGYDGLRSFSGDPSGTPLQAPTGSTSPGVSPAFPYSTALAARQLLFDFNQTRNLVRQNRALTDVALASLTRVQQNVVNGVEIAFYNLVNAQRLVDVAEQNLANRQRQLDLADARFRHGVGVPADVVTAQTSKSQAVLNVQNARDVLLQARYSLLLAMGIDPLTPVELAPSDEREVPTTDPKALVDRGLQRRPEVRAAFSAVSASQYGLSAAKSLNLPSVYFTAAAGTVGSSIGDGRTTGSIGLGLQFPLFDGGTRRGAVQAANGQVVTAVANLKDATIQVRSDVTSAYVALQSAEGRVATADSEVANAREGVRIAEGRYEAGLGLFQDITTAQSQLLTALQDQTFVRNSVNLARVRLRYAMGEIAAALPNPLSS